MWQGVWATRRTSIVLKPYLPVVWLVMVAIPRHLDVEYHSHIDAIRAWLRYLERICTCSPCATKHTLVQQTE
jgi:hypothetical protein